MHTLTARTLRSLWPMLLALWLLPGAVLAQGPRGVAPPLLSGRTPQGEPVSLAQLRGSVVLVFFWSSRCAVCLDKLPELRRNLEGWRGKPFVILAVNQDPSAQDMQAYTRLLDQTAPPSPQMKHLWRAAPEHRDSFGALPLQTPTTLVFDKSGALLRTLPGRVPAGLWDDIAEQVLN